MNPPAGVSLQSPDAFVVSIVRLFADSAGGGRGGERIMFGSIGFAAKDRIDILRASTHAAAFAMSPWIRTVRETPLPPGEGLLGAPLAVGAPLATLRVHQKTEKVVVLDLVYVGSLDIPGGPIWATSPMWNYPFTDKVTLQYKSYHWLTGRIQFPGWFM